MHLKRIRLEKELKAREVAALIGLDEGTYSKIENYKILPIPTDFDKILTVLECDRSEIYTPGEVDLLKLGRGEVVGGARAAQPPESYKLTVVLTNASREVLTKDILGKCGYVSISDWVKVCLRRLRDQYEIISKAEQKNRPAQARNTDG